MELDITSFLGGTTIGTLLGALLGFLPKIQEMLYKREDQKRKRKAWKREDELNYLANRMEAEKLEEIHFENIARKKRNDIRRFRSNALNHFERRHACITRAKEALIHGKLLNRDGKLKSIMTADQYLFDISEDDKQHIEGYNYFGYIHAAKDLRQIIHELRTSVKVDDTHVDAILDYSLKVVSEIEREINRDLTEAREARGANPEPLITSEQKIDIIAEIRKKVFSMK